MSQYSVDEWVVYHQFPDAKTESLRVGKKAVIIDCLKNNFYEIYVDDPNLDQKWRRKVVNEENLSPID